MADYLWIMVVAGGPVAMGLVIAWGMARRRRLTVAEEVARDEGADRLYGRTPGTGPRSTFNDRTDGR